MKFKNLFTEKIFWKKDGGLSTEMERLGWSCDNRSWTSSALKKNPEVIVNSHLNFLESGCEILLTASYQASIAEFLRQGMYLAEARENLFSSVMLAVYAREKYLNKFSNEAGLDIPRRILIGGSIGPYGATLANRSEYTGDYPLGSIDFEEYYHQKIETLIAPRKRFRVDFLAFETIPTIEEANYVLRKMRKYPSMPYWISFSKSVDRIKLCALFEEEIRLGLSNLAAWGFNCRAEDALLDEARRAVSEVVKLNLPFVIYPQHSLNVGMWNGFRKTLMESNIPFILGGCCGTGSIELSSAINSNSN